MVGPCESNIHLSDTSHGQDFKNNSLFWKEPTLLQQFIVFKSQGHFVTSFKKKQETSLTSTHKWFPAPPPDTTGPQEYNFLARSTKRDNIFTLRQQRETALLFGSLANC